MKVALCKPVHFISRTYSAGTPVEVIASRPELGFLVSLVVFPQGEETWVRTEQYLAKVA